MKATGKIIGRLIVGCVFACCLSSFTSQTFAIEGLHVSVQSSNAFLAWPSATNETYIVQFRPDLNAGSSWVTLTNYLPPKVGTNLMIYAHSNSVQYPVGSGGGSGGGGVPMPGGSGGTNYSSGGGTNGSPTTGFYRVVRDGAHMWGITNGMVLHDELITPIEFAVDSTDQVVGVTFYDENNSPIIGASAQPLGGNGWLLVWNTTLSFNGDYNIYAELNFASDNAVVSQPVTVTVDNTISFPNYFSQVFGDEMWIYAQTIPNAAYEIDIYDESTNYLGSFDDYADGGGTISFLWDLTDGVGDTFDSTNFFGVFTVDTSSLPSQLRSQVAIKPSSAANFQTASPAKKTFSAKVKAKGVHANTPGSSASANQLWVKEGRWTPNDYWVLAYSPLTDPSADPNTSYKESLMMLGGPDGNDGGVIGTLDGNDFHGHLSPGNVPQTTAFELSDTNSRAQLLSYLASGSPTYENFYYFGHGNDSAISAYNSAATGITLDQIAFALGNVPLSYSSGPSYPINVDPPIIVDPTESPKMLHAALHPYRFVFLDGCETGAGNICEAFGIPAVTVSTNFFATMKVESRAFLGYTKSISFNTSQWDYRSLMLERFLINWESGAVSLQNCVSDAQSLINQPMDSSAIIYGAYDMMYGTRTRP